MSEMYVAEDLEGLVSNSRKDKFKDFHIDRHSSDRMDKKKRDYKNYRSEDNDVEI